MLLQLKELVDARRPSHNSVFTYLKDFEQVLKAKTISKLMKDLLIQTGVIGATAHSIRGMSSEYLSLVAEISDEEITLRSWKSKSARPTARLLHYRSRITRASFVEIFWAPETPPPLSSESIRTMA
jgi:hypothetical protein